MPEKKVSFKHRLEYALFSATILSTRLSPVFLLRLHSRVLGGLFRALSPRHFRLVSRNLETAFPDMGPAEIAGLRRRIYRHFALIFTQIVYILAKRKPEKILPEIRVDNLAALEEVLRRGRGVILFSGHFGNWELVPFIIRRALGVVTYNVAREMDNPLIERVVSRFREFMGSRIIYKKGSFRSILRELKKNHIVGMIIDQNTLPQEGVYVDFFDHRVSAIPSVSLLHLKRGIPILPVFLQYEPGRLVLDIQDEVVFEKSGDMDRDVRELTERCHALIERKIRQFPEQWLWFHNRWKNRSAGGDDAQRQ